MLDINFIRENSDDVKRRLATKGVALARIDALLEKDSAWRALTTRVDGLRAQLNALSKERKIEEAKKVKGELKNIEAELPMLLAARDELLGELPNLPAEGWLIGKGEADNRVVREVGEKRAFDFLPKDYLTLAEELGIIDVTRAAKVTGSRFGYLFGDAVLLEFALVQFAMSRAISHGFIPVVPPVMVRPDVYKGMGRLSATQTDERYYLPADQLYLVGSAEHTIGPIHMEETLDAPSLPRRYVGFSTCFRREAGSYGKDTKGILRVHQFDKVEFFSFAHPQQSELEHQTLLALQEELVGALELPYRVVQVCTGDMGFTDAKQYDIDTWLPGQVVSDGSRGVYRETNSCSNTADFQARGINARYRDNEGVHYLHLLNATGLAIGRMLIAIIENYQNVDGSITVPRVLRAYVGKTVITK